MDAMKTEIVFKLGMEAGIKAMMDKIQLQHKNGKPVTANGELYWLTDSRQHLQEVMDSVGEENETED